MEGEKPQQENQIHFLLPLQRSLESARSASGPEGSQKLSAQGVLTECMFNKISKGNLVLGKGPLQETPLPWEERGDADGQKSKGRKQEQENRAVCHCGENVSRVALGAVQGARLGRAIT